MHWWAGRWQKKKQMFLNPIPSSQSIVQVAVFHSKHVLVMHPTPGLAQHEGEVLRIKISSAIHQFCVCELVRLQSHNYKTPLGAPVSLNMCCCYLGKWKTAGGALTSPRELWFSLLSPSSLGLTAATVSSLQHQGTARKGPGEGQELTGDLKCRVISWAHPDKRCFWAQPGLGISSFS